MNRLLLRWTGAPSVWVLLGLVALCFVVAWGGLIVTTIPAPSR